MKIKWFRIEHPDGTYRWVCSPNGWAGLISYVTALPTDELYNGTTIREATWFESIACFFWWLIGSELHEEV